MKIDSFKITKDKSNTVSLKNMLLSKLEIIKIVSEN